MVGEDTHLTGLGGDVNLDTVVRVVSLSRMVGSIGALVLHTRWPGRWSVITNRSQSSSKEYPEALNGSGNVPGEEGSGRA